MVVIRRSFKFLDKSTFIPVYKALVRSHLDYASSVWCPHKVKHIELIETVQRRATRMLPSLKGLDYKERLKALKLPSLAYRRIRGDMIEVFKLLHGNYKLADRLKFLQLDPRTTGMNTRGHKMKLLKQKWNNDSRKYAFVVRIVNAWNSLPGDVVNVTSLEKFKSRLDKCWASERILYDFRAPPPGNILI